MTHRPIPPPAVTTPALDESVRLSTEERLRAALRPFARQWVEVEARGGGSDLMAVAPVRVVHLREAAWALDDDENDREETGR